MSPRIVSLVLLGVVLVVVAVYLAAAFGPTGLRAERDRAMAGAREAAEAVREAGGPDIVAESDLTDLPDPVRRLVRRSGAVGRPRPTWVRAVWRGRIRGAVDEPWMSFTAVQENTVDPTSRVFFMDARRSRLPVDVLHVFDESTASMHVRLLSALPIVSTSGAELHRSETVTFLNDLAFLAPGALTDERITWTDVGPDRARARFSAGHDTVEAVLVIDEAGDLVDFVSDDRSRALPNGSGFVRLPWSTPLEGHGPVGPWRLPRRGRAVWHVDGETFVYIEMELVDLTVR